MDDFRPDVDKTMWVAEVLNKHSYKSYLGRVQKENEKALLAPNDFSDIYLELDKLRAPSFQKNELHGSDEFYSRGKALAIQGIVLIFFLSSSPGC